MTACSSSLDGLEIANFVALDACRGFTKSAVFDRSDDFLGGVPGDPLREGDGTAHGAPRPLDRVADGQILHRHAALDQPAPEHVQQRIHAEAVIGGQADLRLRPVEVDGAVGSLEVIALADLLERLIDGVIHFLEIGAGRNVE